MLDATETFGIKYLHLRHWEIERKIYFIKLRKNQTKNGKMKKKPRKYDLYLTNSS